MNNNHKVSKTFLSILSGILAVLTLFFFVQIIVMANTPLSTTVSDNTEDSDDIDDNIDIADGDENDSNSLDYDEDELAKNINAYFYKYYKDMVIIHGRKLGLGVCDLNMDNKPDVLISNYPEDVDFDCFLDVFSIKNSYFNKLDSLTGRFEAYQGYDGVYLVGTNDGKSVCYRISALKNQLSREIISEDDIPSSCYDEPIEFEDYTEDIKEYYDFDSDDSDSNENEIGEAYGNYCKENYSQSAEAGSQIQVGFYDINDDGVTEMIVSSGISEADWQCSVYSYEDNEVYLVDSIYGHYDFYEAESGDGIYIVTGHQGFETLKRMTMNKSGDKLIIQTISEKSLDPDEDYYSNDNPIEFNDITEEFED